MTRLAHRYGSAPVLRYAPTVPPRSLAELALDNATEGCVNETFSAQLATYQGYASSNPEVRRTLRDIAVDETRHGALSLRVHRFCQSRLPRPEARRVESARRGAAARLPSLPLLHSLSDGHARQAGLPTLPIQRRLAHDLSRALLA